MLNILNGIGQICLLSNNSQWKKLRKCKIEQIFLLSNKSQWKSWESVRLSGISHIIVAGNFLLWSLWLSSFRMKCHSLNSWKIQHYNFLLNFPIFNGIILEITRKVPHWLWQVSSCHLLKPLANIKRCVIWDFAPETTFCSETMKTIHKQPGKNLLHLWQDLWSMLKLLVWFVNIACSGCDKVANKYPGYLTDSDGLINLYIQRALSQEV